MKETDGAILCESNLVPVIRIDGYLKDGMEMKFPVPEMSNKKPMPRTRPTLVMMLVKTSIKVSKLPQTLMSCISFTIAQYGDPLQDDVRLCLVVDISINSRSQYGYIKNHKKTVKNGQARARESEEYKKKPKNQSRSQEKSNPQSKWSNHGQQKSTKPKNIPFSPSKFHKSTKIVPGPYWA
ncbi:hypothetical protein Tco_0289420 [Tanacetum coccineum]